MDKIICMILGIIVGIALLATSALAAVGRLSEFMKEREKEHKQWIDPRSDRKF